VYPEGPRGLKGAGVEDVCCSVLHCGMGVCCSVLQCVAVQYVAVYCSVLQCIAACLPVLRT